MRGTIRIKFYYVYDNFVSNDPKDTYAI